MAHLETSAAVVEVGASAECQPPLVAYPEKSAVGVEVVLMHLLHVAVAAEVDPSAGCRPPLMLYLELSAVRVLASVATSSRATLLPYVVYLAVLIAVLLAVQQPGMKLSLETQLSRQ